MAPHALVVDGVRQRLADHGVVDAECLGEAAGLAAHVVWTQVREGRGELVDSGDAGLGVVALAQPVGQAMVEYRIGQWAVVTESPPGVPAGHCLAAVVRGRFRSGATTARSWVKCGASSW